jgi:hypothetical protein
LCSWPVNWTIFNALSRACDLRPGDAAHLQTEADVLLDRHVRKERVVLEHHAKTALFRRQDVDPQLVELDLPAESCSRPAMQLSAVDLPQPDGPRSAMNSPRLMVIVSSDSALNALPPAPAKRRVTLSRRNSLKSCFMGKLLIASARRNATPR